MEHFLFDDLHFSEFQEIELVNLLWAIFLITRPRLLRKDTFSISITSHERKVRLGSETLSVFDRCQKIFSHFNAQQTNSVDGDRTASWRLFKHPAARSPPIRFAGCNHQKRKHSYLWIVWYQYKTLVQMCLSANWENWKVLLYLEKIFSLALFQDKG